MTGQQSHPDFLYGTAWKEATTAELTFNALSAGFTGIDTANQRKHYYEEAVGQGMQKFLTLGIKKREDLFIQTKFTFARGQDHRKPYSESDSYTQQLEDSFASSLKHLATPYVDSYVLHGPFDHQGIGQEDLEVWAAMTKKLANKQAKFLGVSNVGAEQLTELCRQVQTRPQFVQNRCYANRGWDKDVRDICSELGITYQGFSLLTANARELLAKPTVPTLAKKYNKTIPQVVFRFCLQLKMICLNGTTNENHMREDLNIYDFELNSDEVSQLLIDHL